MTVNTSSDDGTNQSFSTAAFIIGAVVGLLSLLLFYLWTRRTKLGNVVIIAGACEAGKTALFARIVFNKTVQTVTSTKENKGLFTTSGGSTLTMVDIPGHDRVRSAQLEVWRDQGCGIIFVVDASNLQKQLRDIVECLHAILSDQHLGRLPILFVCNKQDEAMAKRSGVVRRELEREVEVYRKLKSGSNLQSLDGSSNKMFRAVGREDADFSFDHVDAKVEWCELSAANEGDEQGLEELKTWLDQRT